MAYSSPKTLRRRQIQAETPATRRNTPHKIKVASQEEWESTCGFHLTSLHGHIFNGYGDAAGRHARALVTMTVYRRAGEIMNELSLRSAWKAVSIARIELLGKEPA